MRDIDLDAALGGWRRLGAAHVERDAQLRDLGIGPLVQDGPGDGADARIGFEPLGRKVAIGRGLTAREAVDINLVMTAALKRARKQTA